MNTSQNNPFEHLVIRDGSPIAENNIEAIKPKTSTDINSSVKFWDDFFGAMLDPSDTSSTTITELIEELIQQYFQEDGGQISDFAELDRQVFLDVDIDAIKMITGSYLDTADFDSVKELAPLFSENEWSELSVEEKERRIIELAARIDIVLELKDPPNITFYYNEDGTDYGGYDLGGNTIMLNEYYMNDPAEVVDTISHELWHTHQRECSEDQLSERGNLYSYNFKNYVSASDNYSLYSTQLVEIEARTFASDFSRRFYS